MRKPKISRDDQINALVVGTHISLDMGTPIDSLLGKTKHVFLKARKHIQQNRKTYTVGALAVVAVYAMTDHSDGISKRLTLSVDGLRASLHEMTAPTPAEEKAADSMLGLVVPTSAVPMPAPKDHPVPKDVMASITDTQNSPVEKTKLPAEAIEVQTTAATAPPPKQPSKRRVTPIKQEVVIEEPEWSGMLDFSADPDVAVAKPEPRPMLTEQERILASAGMFSQNARNEMERVRLLQEKRQKAMASVDVQPPTVSPQETLVPKAPAAPLSEEEKRAVAGVSNLVIQDDESEGDEIKPAQKSARQASNIQASSRLVFQPPPTLPIKIDQGRMPQQQSPSRMAEPISERRVDEAITRR